MAEDNNQQHGGQRVISPPLHQLHTLRTKLQPGEEKVLHFFDTHLPAEWEIYIQPHLNGLRPDFVLLHPAQGIAVFEVKDWSPNTLRNSRGEKPVDKIDRYKREIYSLYCPRLRRRAGFGAITAGLIFPYAPDKLLERELKAHREELGHQSHRSLYPLIGSHAISSGRLSRVFPRAAKNQNSPEMSAELADDLRSWLREPDLSEEQRKLPALSAKQKVAIEQRTSSGFRRIKGPAGCGKSLVLAGRAAKLAAEGKDVLVVSYNITLLNHLMDLAVRFGGGGMRRQVTWLNIHTWMKRSAHECGYGKQYGALWKKHFERIPSDEEGSAPTNEVQDMLEQKISELLREALTAENGATHYDAILVDEGQDFRPEWWQRLRSVLHPGGEMLLVSDATQDIYGQAASWTEEVMKGAGFVGPWYELGTSYRLPTQLAHEATRFARQFLPESLVIAPVPVQTELGIEPCELRWVQTDAARDDQTLEEVLRLYKKDDDANRPTIADLTILVDSERTGKELVRRLNSLGIRTIHTFGDTNEEARRKKVYFFMGDARVKVTTLHSFKGWESSTIVLSIGRASDVGALSCVYTAMTRLLRTPRGSHLSVVCSAPELAEYGSGWTKKTVPAKPASPAAG